jgi:DNA-binding CsgD family transcriptional regulator
MVELLPLKIRIHEAIVAIDSIDVAALSPANKIAFYETTFQINLYLTSIYSNSKVNMPQLYKVGASCDSLLSLMKEGEDGYLLYQGTSYIIHNNISLGIATLRDYLSTIGVNHPRYQYVVSMLSLAYYMRGRYDEWCYYTALAALCENEQAFLDGESLRQLGWWLYSKGDAPLAYNFIALAEENESQSGAVVHRVQASEAVPLISRAYRQRESDYVTLLCIIVGCLIVVIILVFVALHYRSRERVEFLHAKKELTQANEIKERYLGQMISFCYVYIDKIDDMGKVVMRKLAAGQADDLYHQIKAGKMEDEHRQLFFKEFDSAFIHIYPTFIHDIKALMKEDVDFGEADAESLTPELRILAFMRLGIDDSGKIARFLGLSVNTVYTYRNRMKARAANRDTFESEVMKIGRF